MGSTLNNKIWKNFIYSVIVSLDNFPTYCKLYVFSLLLIFYHSVIFPCIYVIIIISIKHFADIKIVCTNLLLLYWPWPEPKRYYKYIKIFYEFHLLFAMASRFYYLNYITAVYMRSKWIFLLLMTLFSLKTFGNVL